MDRQRHLADGGLCGTGVSWKSWRGPPVRAPGGVMPDWLVMALVLGGYLALQLWVLPRLGIAT